MSHELFMSLDEARSELRRRWNDTGLKNAVESALGQRFMMQFRETPRAMLLRQVVTPDNGFMLFNYCAAYLGAVPLAIEYLGDRLAWMNEEKRNLGRPRVSTGTDRFQVRLLDLALWEDKPLNEITLGSGEAMVDFYHRLFGLHAVRAQTFDITPWYRAIGKPTEYYYPLFAHAIAHSVWFEAFVTEDEPCFKNHRKTERWFTDEVVRPNFERVTRDFGLRPMVVRSFPKNQTDDEDFYWYSYPPIINDYLVEYAHRHRLSFKKITSYAHSHD